MSAVRHPGIEVELIGQDGNAFVVLGLVQRALRRGLRQQGLTLAAVDAEVRLFSEEACAGDYDHLLRTCMEWVEVV